MRTSPPLLLLAALALALPLSAQPGPRPSGGPTSQVLLIRAGAEQVNAAVRAADDERVAAMRAADQRRLDEVLSEAMHYGHSNGMVDTKASFVASLTSGRVVYESVEYAQRDFLIAGDDLVLMTGRAKVRAGLAGQVGDLELAFLAVWRLEAGRWRFLAWQSTRLPSTPAR